MALVRYIVYFVGFAAATWLLTSMEIEAPGSLRFHVLEHSADLHGTSEYSAVEILQPILLLICGLLYAWVARDCPSQRPIAFTFGGVALLLIIYELDYFLDRLVADNFTQIPAAVIAALVMVYTYRHRRRFRVGWLRLWPSPGLTLLFAGAMVQFIFVPIVGQEALWAAILGDAYRPAVSLAVDELTQLVGYCLWLVGTIEYAFQARAIAFREPQPAAAKRRAGRHPKSEGRF